MDPIQKDLNDFVMNFDVQSRPGFCGFRLREIFDEDLNRYKTVAAHNCQGYAVELTLYMMPSDWDMIEKTFTVNDIQGKPIYENVQ